MAIKNSMAVLVRNNRSSGCVLEECRAPSAGPIAQTVHQNPRTSAFAEGSLSMPQKGTHSFKISLHHPPLAFLPPPPWQSSCPITPPLYPFSIVTVGPRPLFSQATSTLDHPQETSSPASSTAFRRTKRWRRTSSLAGTRRRKRGREIARGNGPKLRRGCDRGLRKLAYLFPSPN